MTLTVDSVSHWYGDEQAVTDVSFSVASGELVALLGPSGCGKTTLIQAIAGHIQPTSGRISLRGTDVTEQPPESRHIGLVFQQPTLYPQMTVAENVAYGLAGRGVDRAKRESVVADHLELVDLADQRDAVPAALSGGQQRRVELARAVAPAPDVLLLDEPLSALDRALRERLCDEIDRIHRETGVTTLFVTHDQREAMSLADRIVVLNEGRVSAIGTPRELYQSPPNQFVASFLGWSTPLAATVSDHEPLVVSLASHALTLASTTVSAPVGASVTCQFRPESLSVIPAETATADDGIGGTVTAVRDRGRHYDVTVGVETGETLAVEQTARPPAVGETVVVAIDPQAVTVFS